VEFVTERGLVRLLNNREPKVVSSLARLLKEAAIAEAKRMVRSSAGDRIYFFLKRSAGIPHIQ
jgi:hypothetical protein